MVDAQDITGLLAAWSRGDERALSDVIPLVYEDLRRIARKAFVCHHAGVDPLGKRAMVLGAGGRRGPS